MRRLICTALLLTALFTGRSSAANNYIIAPQILREGVWETVILNLHGVDGVVDVVASLNLEGIQPYNFNNKNAQEPILMRVKYEKPRDAQPTNRRQYVELIVTVRKAGANVYSSNLKMRLIEDSGFLHVQTDRPIYRPEETVNIRIAALTQQQFPEREREVEMIIRIPLDKVGVERKIVKMTDAEKFIETNYAIPEYPEYGVWSIEVRFLDQKVVRWSTVNFEIRPYVLPTFNVRIELDNPFIAVKGDMSEEYIRGTITARYSYGKTVSGSYFLVAKLKRPDYENPVQFYQFPAELEKTAVILNGRAGFEIKATSYLDAFPDVSFSDLEKEGASVIIEVSVTGDDEGTIESDISRPVPFLRSPYTLDSSRMSRYYTPGIAFEMKVDLLNTVTKDPVEDIVVILTGPITCGPTVCPEGQCCIRGVCVPCAEPVSIFKKKTDENGQINVKVNMESDAVTRKYLIQTRDFDIDDENEASMTFTLEPYTSKSGSVLQLSAATKIAEVEDRNFEIDVWYKKAPKELRYFITARGAIFSTGIHFPPEGGIQTTMKIPIEGEMVPSFKIFVYYLTTETKELVSNSLWVDVTDACKREIEVAVPDQVLPGEEVTVEYTGSPGAIVGVSAVDRAAYFLYGESRLTRKDVFKNLNQYDQGCVREGGKNAQHVFEEGGFQLVGGPYAAKEDFTNHCEGPKAPRAKRSAGNTAKIEAKFDEEAMLLGCSFDGLMENLAEETCADRAKRVEKLESFKCAEIFYESCKKQTRLAKIARSGARSAGNNAANYKGLATTRSDFEESMLWTTIMLDRRGKYSLKRDAKDSITTFEFDTISMHSSDGFCVAPTENMRVFKNVFIQLKVPYSLKRREQTEIRASVFNYGQRSERITVRVKMGKDICSHFPEGQFSDVMTLLVEPETAETTSFSILPLRVPKNEKVEIEVQAINERNDILDHIRKWILVEPEGEIRDIKGTHAIDLRKKNKESFEIKLNFPEKYTLGTRQCWLYPFSNFMGPIIEFDPVTKQPKNDVKNIIRMPGGCGEQTMLSMGPNVYAHRYLFSVGRMPPGSPEEQGSINKMKSGFANELKYRCNCNPKVWSVFPRHAPSVWLNAYVNKVFAQAKEYYKAMDVAPICSSVGWLTTMQNADGSFKSGGRVIHQEMHGAVGSTLSLTAYVLMSLVESASLCPQHTKAAEEAIFAATNYLKANEGNRQMEQPYALSLACYALSLSNPVDPFSVRMRAKLLNKIQYTPDKRLAFWKGAPLQDVRGTGTHSYWYQRKPLAIDIEATAYSLMAILHGETAKPEISQSFIDISRKIMLWLIEQRDENGGFTTTQDTVVGLQALSEYMIWSNTAEPPSNDVSIDLKIATAEGTFFYENPIRIHLNKSNENVTLPIPLPDVVVGAGNINVEATGEGEGTLSYRCVYRTLVDEESCHFDLAVSTSLHNDNVDSLKEMPVKVKILIQLSKPRGLPSGQSIVEVNLMSGYEPDEDSLQKLSRTYFVDGSVERYETANQRVYLYLKEITVETIRLAFLVKQTLKVRDPEPATVTVMDYYEPSVRCSQFYGLPGDVPRLRESCQNENAMGGEDMCKCAEGGCIKCRTRQEQLQKTACLPGITKCELCKEDDETRCFNMTAMACKGSYAYEVTIQKGVEDATGIFVDFIGQIKTVFKRGPDAAAKPDEVRKFISRTDCYQACTDREALNKPDREGNVNPFMMTTNMTVLVIGTLYEENNDKDGRPQRQYHLGEGAFMERIYPPSKCKSAKETLESKGCMKKKKKQSKKQRAKCSKATGIDQSCKNLNRMKSMLRRGCDAV